MKCNALVHYMSPHLSPVTTPQEYYHLSFRDEENKNKKNQRIFLRTHS